MGVLPTCWPIKTYFGAAEGTAGVFWLAAVVWLVHPSACVAFLCRRFRVRAMAG